VGLGAVRRSCGTAGGGFAAWFGADAARDEAANALLGEKWAVAEGFLCINHYQT
jgi:hypothetical protein